MEGLKKNILRATTGACGGARRSHHIRARYRCRAGSVSSAHLLRPGQHTAPAVKPHMRQKGTASTVGGEHLHHVLEVAAGPHHRETGRGAQARRGRQQGGQDHDECQRQHSRSADGQVALYTDVMPPGTKLKMKKIMRCCSAQDVHSRCCTPVVRGDDRFKH